MMSFTELNRGNHGYTGTRLAVSLLDQMVCRPIQGDCS
jgi:hypothetical protein